MATRSKEEQRLLDEKIARIQKKNEEILRRQKEIEEDKRLAEQQNAVVKLRPSTANASRERTPALKPSKEKQIEDYPNDTSFQESEIDRSTRGSFRSRGVERYRGQADWKTTGPPPDPRSFLYDEDRDAHPSREKDKQGDLRRELNRRRSGDDPDGFRGDNRGAREFQRGGQRDNFDGRRSRGMRGRGRTTRNEEEAWRAERMMIDEARIQRQKSADGKWRREWDNEKIQQEPSEEPKYESRGASEVHQEQRQPSSQYHCPRHSPTENCPRRAHREGPVTGGKGRGRLAPSELLTPIDDSQFKLVTPLAKTLGGFSFAEDSSSQWQLPSPSPSSPSFRSQDDEYSFESERQIKCVGNTFKISVPNSSIAQATPKPPRPLREHRGRLKSQPSYSSQSDEDSPRDRGYRGSRKQRSQRHQRGRGKSDNSSAESTPETLSGQKKPPLPPFKSEHKAPSQPETKEADDGSWEDVTTSGTESMGEDLSKNSTHVKKTTQNTETRGQVVNVLDEYLKKVGWPQENPRKEFKSGNNEIVEENDMSFEQVQKNNLSSDIISLDTSYSVHVGDPETLIDTSTVQNLYSKDESFDKDDGFNIKENSLIEETLIADTEDESKVKMSEKSYNINSLDEICSENGILSDSNKIVDSLLDRVVNETNTIETKDIELAVEEGCERNVDEVKVIETAELKNSC